MLIYALLMIASGIACALTARDRGHSVAGWLAGGILLPILSLFIISKSVYFAPGTHPRMSVQWKVSRGILLAVSFFFLIGMIGAAFNSDDAVSVPKEPEPSPKPVEVQKQQEEQIVHNSSWDGSVRQVEQYLDQNLRDPDSFKAIEWSDVVKTENGFMVRCKYRAKNGFGGYEISNQIFYLDRSGSIYLVQDV